MKTTMPERTMSPSVAMGNNMASGRMINGQMMGAGMKGGKRALVVCAVLLALGVAWYLFRPELLFINSTVDEKAPTVATAKTTTLASGVFHKGAHETKDMATIQELPGGQRVLRLTDFETSNGPDVRVLLVAAPDAVDSDSVTAAERIELGKLKGNVGNQNYELPQSVDLAKYRAVTIWCNRFGVNFGTAPLVTR